MKIYKQILGILLSLIICSEAWATFAKLTDLQVQTDSAAKKLGLVIEGNVDYKWFLLNNPERLIIDLAGTKLQTALNRINLTELPIKAIRSGIQKNGALRLVFDLKQASKPQIATNANGLVITFNGQSAQLSSAKSNSADATAKLAIVPVKPVMSLANRGQRNVVVVIDPGHGGKDPGAIGVRGTREKDVVLAISKELALLLNNTQGYSAVLTRKDDTFIELRGRLKLARKDKADMFVAIHADAFNNSTARGSSVFALSAHGASSEAARWLAERENYSELGGINLNQLNDKDNMLRSVLIDLSQNATLSSSLQLGSAVLHALGKINRLHHGSVEQAPFMVLKSPDIPSILVETGFLSNPPEEDNLRSPAYQRKMAQALHQGIMDYFQQNPPEGSLIAVTAKPQRYIVVRGDTIASIAQKFKTSVAVLKQTNNLSSNSLNLGQILLIPHVH